MYFGRRIKNPTTFGTMGALSLAAGLLIQRFGSEIAMADFLVGMLIGMSLVFNITFLVKWRTEKARG